MRSILLSILVHMLLLITTTNNINDVKQGNPTITAHIKIVEKPIKKEINDKQIADNSTKIVVKKKKILKQKYEDHKCDQWYGGIGILYVDDISHIVNYVGKGYPADRAGIIKGDLIINGIDEITGKPGTRVIVKVLRGSNALTFHIIREKICTKDIEP